MQQSDPGRKKKKTSPLLIIFLVILIYGSGFTVIVTPALTVPLLIVWIAGGAVLIVLNGRRKNTGTKARPEKRTQEKKPCANPEPHRHFEADKSCPNPEPHRHAAVRPQPVSREQQDRTAKHRRRKNMKILYDAGLLTREEYHNELRRIDGA